MFNFIRLFFFSIVFFSSSAYAQNYYWEGKSGAIYSSPVEACKSLATYSDGSLYSDWFAHKKTETTWGCRFSSGAFGYGDVHRKGNSCPQNTEYDSETGECVTPEPEPTKCEVGEITSHLFPSKKFGDFYVTLAPQQMCQNSCVVNQVTTSSGTKGCIPFAQGRYCYAQFSVTDEKCDVNDDLPQAPQVDESTAIDPKDEDQEDGTNSNNCTLVVDQEGRHVYNCNPPPEQGNCPDGWLLGADGSTCYRDPNADKDPEAGDGGSDGSDGGSGGEGGDGNDKDGDKDKQGAEVLKRFDENNKLLGEIKKAIQDKPVGGGGAGGGDGSHNNPDKDKGSVSGGDGCDSEPTCVGDVIQCAILAQNHKSRCEAKELADFEKHKDDISNLFEGDEFQLHAGEDIEVESFLTGHSRWLPSNCPRPERVTLGTNGQSLSLSYDPMCKLANSISPLIIILATLFATVYIGRSSGG